ncbi:3-ketoacyl-CoA synthase 11-like protein [Tanacetum coccineum]
MACNELNVEGLFSKTVSAISASNMVREVTNEEIKAAMFDTGDDKSPGPDGYTFVFFKKGWNIVGYDVCNTVCDFFSNGCLLKEINHTFLDLIPKELMRNYHRNRGPQDVRLRLILKKRMIWWIGVFWRTFSPGKKGLRQGDPLSPYLFTMVMEILTLILKRRVRLSNLSRFHKHREELKIINVCFADDLYIFACGDLNSACVIMESLDEFKKVSGLVPSIPKSTTYFCNVVYHIKLSILSIMPFSVRDSRLNI